MIITNPSPPVTVTLLKISASKYLRQLFRYKSPRLPGLSVILFLAALVMGIAGCSGGEEGGEYRTVQGFTQGTSYRVTYQHPSGVDLKERIDSLLGRFDRSLNAYEEGSLISAINRNEPGVKTDTLFRTLFRESARVNRISGGVFDITLGPVIDAWGFGTGERKDVDSAMVDSLLQYVGMEKVWLAGDSVVKALPQVELNVNAIAQGFSVDFVSAFLDSLGCRNFLVEIGGEIRTRGVNPDGTFWRIGVDRPEFGNMIPGEQMQVIIRMHDRALATSGNYRKFYMKEGVRITHSIDPASGYPKDSRLLSATILAGRCMTADAYATACMVMGLEKARAFISGLKGIDAYLIYGDDQGRYRVWYTKGLKKYIERP